MAVVLLAPEPLAGLAGLPGVFLAGSIEMGLAEDWQSLVTQALLDLPVALLNPRRREWDSSWRQALDEPRFREQVEWELEAQERAALILMYFAPNTRAPITLLELGLFAHSGKLLVCCPEGFWRKGNVDVVCARYGVPTVPDLPGLIATARQRLGGGP